MLSFGNLSGRGDVDDHHRKELSRSKEVSDDGLSPLLECAPQSKTALEPTAGRVSMWRYPNSKAQLAWEPPVQAFDKATEPTSLPDSRFRLVSARACEARARTHVVLHKAKATGRHCNLAAHLFSVEKALPLNRSRGHAIQSEPKLRP